MFAMYAVLLWAAIYFCVYIEESECSRSPYKFPTSLKDIDLSRGPPPTLFEKLRSSVSSRFQEDSPTPATPTIALPWRSRIMRGFEQFREKTSFFGGQNNKKKMLILMSDTGGGHRASAEALDQAIQEKYPGRIDVTVMDIWTDHGRGAFRKLVPLYRSLAKRPILWRAFYSYGLFPPTRMLTELDSQIQCYSKFKKAMETADPDFVVSVHPLCQQMPISIVKEMNRKRPSTKPRIPFVTIVTDLGSAHCTWFDPRADAVFVPSEAVRDLALYNHMPAAKILMKGLPIRPAFWKPSRSKAALRRAFNMDADSRAVLLMGGGDGVGGISAIATEVANKLKALDFKTHLTVICGYNEKTKADLTRALVVPTIPAPSSLPSRQAFGGLLSNWPFLFSQRTPAKGLRVSVQGFVRNIDEYMAASDLLVTKAGPGTIAEAMTRGLPMVLSSFLPGQVCLFVFKRSFRHVPLFVIFEHSLTFNRISVTGDRQCTICHRREIRCVH